MYVKLVLNVVGVTLVPVTENNRFSNNVLQSLGQLLFKCFL